MDVAEWLDIVLTSIGILVGLAALYTLWFAVRSMRGLLAAVEDVRIRLVPLLDKTDVTVDAINAELLRIDAIVSQAEGVGDAVSTASDFIRSPVNSAAQSIARLARTLGRR